MAGYAWSAAEIGYLRSITSDLPYSLAIATYRKWAKMHGYPWRSTGAITRKMEEFGSGRTAIGSYINACAAAKLARISTATLYRWVNLGLIPVYREGVRIYIKRTELVKFARRHPQRFQGLPYSDLICLFSSERLAEQLAAMPRASRNGQKRRVRASDGRIFNSIDDAGAAVHVTASAISQAIRKGHQCIGLHWSYADSMVNGVVSSNPPKKSPGGVAA